MRQWHYQRIESLTSQLSVIDVQTHRKNYTYLHKYFKQWRIKGGGLRGLIHLPHLLYVFVYMSSHTLTGHIEELRMKAKYYHYLRRIISQAAGCIRDAFLFRLNLLFIVLHYSALHLIFTPQFVYNVCLLPMYMTDKLSYIIVLVQSIFYSCSSISQI